MTSFCPTFGAAACIFLLACHRAPPPAGAASDAGADSEAPEALPQAPAVVGPARCRATDGGAAVFEAGGAPELDLGDAVPFAGGVAIALLHRASGDRVAAIALLRPDVDARARVIDLGPTLGDAPPPRLAVRSGELVAAFHGAPPRTAGAAERVVAGPVRLLVVDAVAADGSVAPLFSVDEQRDDSLASDVASVGDHGLIVWDEATREPRGVIRGVTFAGRQKAAASVELSPRESDAELPRVVAFGKGFAVAWIARGPEAASSPPDGSDLEVTGEPRTRGWLELLLVDDHGVGVGPVRRLTPPSGHVTAYDLRATSSAAAAAPGATREAQPMLLLVARDDGEAVDGSGGSLLRVRAFADSAEPPVAFVTDGLGRGAPTLVDGDPAWLAWVGAGEQLRLLPLDAVGAPAGLPSAEDGMDEARPVLALPAGRLLLETPSDAARQLRTFACSR